MKHRYMFVPGVGALFKELAEFGDYGSGGYEEDFVEKEYRQRYSSNLYIKFEDCSSLILNSCHLNCFKSAI